VRPHKRGATIVNPLLDVRIVTDQAKLYIGRHTISHAFVRTRLLICDCRQGLAHTRADHALACGT